MGSDPTAKAGSPGPGRYRFGGIVLDAAAHTLTRDGQPQALEPKAFAVLLELVGHAGELVGRDQLLDAVWGHRHVTPGVLTRAIAQLRTALDDDSHHPRYIQTQHALGYRFIGTLEPGETAPAAGTADAAPTGTAAPPADWEPPAYPTIERRRRSRNQPWHWLAFAGLLFAALAWNAWQRKAEEAHRPAEASIAVLPFTMLSDDTRDRYFAEGLAAEMLNALAGVHGIRVAAWIPPEAVDRKLDIKTLGRQLGVATVLDASVRREGQRLRISARLADTASGYTLWTQTYERETSAVFDTQTEIANEVAKALLGVLPDAGEGLRKRLTPTRNFAAFDAYLRGTQLMIKPAAADTSDAIGHFRRALELDAGFARAQAGLCRAEIWRFEGHRNADAFDNARLACLRAANMDPSIGSVQLALGDLYRSQARHDKALEHYRLAQSDQSVLAEALIGQANVLAAQGQGDEAMALFQQAIKMRPGDANLHSEVAYRYYEAGKPAEAIASMRTATGLQPDNAHNWSFYGALLMSEGRNDEAVAAFERSLAIEPVEAVIANLGTLHYQAGDYAKAAAKYREAIALNPGLPQLWGNLGDALLADPATIGEARGPFEEAATRAQAYVDVKQDDAKALAMLGWFRANLGERDAALDLVRRAEALDREHAEVALYNAETFALLGDLDSARKRIAAARQAGMPDVRIHSNAVFRRAGLVPGDAATKSS